MTTSEPTRGSRVERADGGAAGNGTTGGAAGQHGATAAVPETAAPAAAGSGATVSAGSGATVSAGSGATVSAGEAPVGSPRPGAGPAGRPSLGWTELGVLVGTVVVLFVVAVVVAIVAGAGPETWTGPIGTNVVVAVGAVVFGLSALAAVAVRVRATSALGLRATTWRWLLAGVGVGLLVRVVAIGVGIGWIALTGDGSSPQQELLGTAASGSTALVLILLTGAVLTPIGEELAFRGVIYGALRRYGVLVALVVSAVVFALAHGISILLVSTLVLGVLNALLYERSRSIWPSIVSHAVYNTSGFVLAALLAG